VLEEPTAAGRTLVRDDNAIKGLLLRARASEADMNGHEPSVSSQRSKMAAFRHLSGARKLPSGVGSVKNVLSAIHSIRAERTALDSDSSSSTRLTRSRSLPGSAERASRDCPASRKSSALPSG